MQPFVKTIHSRGVLSFAPDSEPLPLTPLNVLIGPNGSGKSNLIEVFELLKALPTDLAEVIRYGGGIGEWLWRGEGGEGHGAITAELSVLSPLLLRYRLVFGHEGMVTDETIEKLERAAGAPDSGEFLYRIQKGRPVLRIDKRDLPAADAARAKELADGEVAFPPALIGANPFFRSARTLIYIRSCSSLESLSS